MPSKLPVIRANTTSENIEKMKYIAKYNKRSLAKELEYIIEKHISEFEIEHGEIIVDAKKEDSTAVKIIKTATGIYAGQALADIAIEMSKKKKENNSDN